MGWNSREALRNTLQRMREIQFTKSEKCNQNKAGDWGWNGWAGRAGAEKYTL